MPSRPRPLPLRCRNAQFLLPTNANPVAMIVAMAVAATQLTLKPLLSRFVRPIVITNARMPTTPNLATSWISTSNRVYSERITSTSPNPGLAGRTQPRLPAQPPPYLRQAAENRSDFLGPPRYDASGVRTRRTCSCQRAQQALWRLHGG